MSEVNGKHVPFSSVDVRGSLCCWFFSYFSVGFLFFFFFFVLSFLFLRVVISHAAGAKVLDSITISHKMSV